MNSKKENEESSGYQPLNLKKKEENNGGNELNSLLSKLKKQKSKIDNLISDSLNKKKKHHNNKKYNNNTNKKEPIENIKFNQININNDLKKIFNNKKRIEIRLKMSIKKRHIHYIYAFFYVI